MSVFARFARLLLPRRRSHPRQPFDEPKRFGRPNKRDAEEGGVPVDPNKPNTLSGGAAAALELDD